MFLFEKEKLIAKDETCLIYFHRVKLRIKTDGKQFEIPHPQDEENEAGQTKLKDLIKENKPMSQDGITNDSISTQDQELETTR